MSYPEGFAEWSLDERNAYFAAETRRIREESRAKLNGHGHNDAEPPLPASSDDYGQRAASSDPSPTQTASPGLIWYGQSPPKPPPSLVDETLPETGIAIVAGQYGAGKTFVGGALVAAVITGSDFAGRAVNRKGGALWLAAEGENEIEGRVRAALARVGETAERQPFCRQAGSVPLLRERDALAKLIALAKEAADHLRANFDLPLVAIFIDTIAGAAGFDDENSASETQKVLNSLRALSRETGALVVPIDHHGKVAETGIRGSSAKGAAADAILACLCDKDAAGVVTNRRMAIAKLRAGPTGRVIPFDLIQTEDRTSEQPRTLRLNRPRRSPRGGLKRSSSSSAASISPSAKLASGCAHSSMAPRCWPSIASKSAPNSPKPIRPTTLEPRAKPSADRSRTRSS
jgi:hypothetical protein